MAELLTLLVLVAGLLLAAGIVEGVAYVRHWRGKDLIDGYVDPGRPRARVVPQAAAIAASEAVRPLVGDGDSLPAIGDYEESGYRTTSLRLVK